MLQHKGMEKASRPCRQTAPADHPYAREQKAANPAENREPVIHPEASRKTRRLRIWMPTVPCVVRQKKTMKVFRLNWRGKTCCGKNRSPKSCTRPTRSFTNGSKTANAMCHGTIWTNNVNHAVKNVIVYRRTDDDMPFILYTSGSTGNPKGAQHASGGFLLRAIMSMRWEPWKSSPFCRRTRWSPK